MVLKAVMVDVDGVVASDDGGWHKHLERDLGLCPRKLHEAFFEPHWEDVVLGRAPLRERLAPALATVAPHIPSDILVDYWFTRVSLDEQLLSDLAEVRSAGFPVHLVTVQEHERATYLWTHLGLQAWFDAMHYSAALGTAKPDPSFYAAVEGRTGYGAQELFLIDDRADNVAAALDRGWRGAIWTGKERFRDLWRSATELVG